MLSYFIILWNETIVTTVASKSSGLGKMWLWLTLLPIPHSKWMFSVPYTDNEADIIWKCTLACLWGVYVQTVCIKCHWKREEVCAECSCASSPHETKGDFAFLEGPCEAVKLFTELKIYVMFSVSVHFFFINTTPFGRGSHALPCMDSGVTWVYSWTLNRNKKKKRGITKTWHLLTRLKQQVWTNRGRKWGKQQNGTSGACRTDE